MLRAEDDVLRLLRQAHEVREQHDQLRHPALYAKPELIATSPTESVVLGYHQAQGSDQVGLLPPVRDPRHLRPRTVVGFDGGQKQERRPRRAADRRDTAPSGGGSNRTAHHPRRPSHGHPFQQGRRAPLLGPRHRWKRLLGPASATTIPSRCPSFRTIRVRARVPDRFALWNMLVRCAVRSSPGPDAAPRPRRPGLPRPGRGDPAAAPRRSLTPDAAHSSPPTPLTRALRQRPPPAPKVCRTPVSNETPPEKTTHHDAPSPSKPVPDDTEVVARLPVPRTNSVGLTLVNSLGSLQ